MRRAWLFASAGTTLAVGAGELVMLLARHRDASADDSHVPKGAVIEPFADMQELPLPQERMWRRQSRSLTGSLARPTLQEDRAPKGCRL